MDIEQYIIDTFYQYAYQPGVLYFFICCFMTASSFGLPIPEELVLVTSGLIAYMGMHPDKYPPPVVGAEAINVYTLAAVCFFAVWASDILIYTIGRYTGDKLFKTKYFSKAFSQTKVDKFNNWFQKYSYWACGFFRFMPGIRFFGHLTCGAMKIPVLIFICVDGIAALISVPTQILLVAKYGEVIIAKFKEFKLILLALFALAAIILFIKNQVQKKKDKIPDNVSP